MSKAVMGTLTGKFFHSVLSDRETIELQGKFIALASPGVYLVQTYEWITGMEYEQLLVPVTEMRYWRIYDTREDWIRAYEAYNRTQTNKEKSEASRG